ncbi:MAG: D-2-hydroxyacid dehydrogenase, partial [Clostridia bacterium]|nr:D-2-hydroxyacid dehydrogenase [Clostridia bacterium]
MKITILDEESLVRDNDIDFSAFYKLGTVEKFGVLPKLEAANLCKDSDAVIVNKTVVDKEFMDIAKNLKYIGLFATGYNNIDLVEASKRNITVCNAPNYSTFLVAQFVFSYILALSNSLIEYNDSVKKGGWIKSKTFCYFPYDISELQNKTIGIIGYGNIGKQVAKFAKAFDMNILVSTRTNPTDGTVNYPKEYVFKNSDYITIHCPLNKDTEKMVNLDLLKTM